MRRLPPVLAVLIWYGSLLAENPVEFQDERLKAAIEERLGVCEPTPADMLGLTRLVADSLGIADLTGLEYATNLQYLYLSWNEIRDVSALSSLVNLERLDLNHNQISDISPLSGLRHLHDLNIHGNQVCDISALSGVASLQTLVLRFNLISDVSALAGLAHLQALDIRDNQIGDISALCGLIHLQDLTASNNQILDISALSRLSCLQTLWLSFNQVSDISALSGLVSLQDLYLCDNQICDISPLVDLTSLGVLDIRGNPLNQDAWDLYIPQIVANNPGIRLFHDTLVAYCLSTSSTAGGSVTVPGEGVFTFPSGEVVSVEARADPGFVFVKWSESLLAAQNPVSVFMDHDYQIRAHFVSIRDVLYVDDDAPTDLLPGDPSAGDPQENGTPEHPFDSIQEAIEVAAEGATVLVREGYYRENIDFLEKCITVTSLNASGSESPLEYPIVAGTAEREGGQVVTFDNVNDPNAWLSGFVITRGYGFYAGGVFCSNSSPTIQNCLIVGNRASSNQGAGGAVYAVDSKPVFVNCTMSGNYAPLSGAGLSSINSEVVIINSILYKNLPEEISSDVSSALTVGYTDVAGGYPGEGNIDLDPQFELPGYWEHPLNPGLVVQPGDYFACWATGDYHLKGESRCIDAGDPSAPCRDEPEPNGCRINMGAYGGTIQATQSPTGAR